MYKSIALSCQRYSIVAYIAVLPREEPQGGYEEKPDPSSGPGPTADVIPQTAPSSLTNPQAHTNKSKTTLLSLKDYVLRVLRV